MNDVFVDTVGLIAVWDIRDQWHAAAEAAYQELLEQGRRLVTTPLIFLECGNAASRPFLFLCGPGARGDRPGSR